MKGLNATPSVIAGTILVVDGLPNLYSGLLPSMFTISSPFFHDQEAKEGNVKRIRQGEVIATIMGVALIFAAAELFQSPLPIIGGAAMMAVLLLSYEYALKNPATEDGKTNLPQGVASLSSNPRRPKGWN